MFPVRRLSRTMTFSALFIILSTKCEPIKPAPPVIKYLIIPPNS